MSRKLYLGLEYHDLGIRGAICFDGKLKHLPDVADLMPEKILFDPSTGIASLGVSFPGLFSTIGTNLDLKVGRDITTAGEITKAAVQILRLKIERELHLAVVRTVIGVPASMTSIRRNALRESVVSAGFENVELIDGSIALGLAHAGSQHDPISQLVYFLDYGGCSCALLRSVRGRIKIIDQALISGVSGQLCDALAMEAIVLALRDQKVFLGLRSFNRHHWLEFHRIAAAAREALARKPSVDIVLPAALVSDQRSIHITLSAAGLAQLLGPTIRSTTDEVVALLERNELATSQIDAVLALGHTAVRSPVSDSLDRLFPGKVEIAIPGSVAVGAALYGRMLDPEAEKPIDLSHYLSPFTPPESAEGRSADGPVVPFVTTIRVEDPGSTRETSGGLPNGTAARMDDPSAANGQSSVDAPGASPVDALADAATELIKQGRFRDAARVLERMPSGTAATNQPAPAHTPNPLVLEAEVMLSQGRVLEAIALSHKAYEEAQQDSAVFASMLSIHIEAGLSLSRPEDYEDAISVLMCAYAHDQTDRSIQKALAARHYQHGQALDQLNKAAEAIEAASQAVRFDPKHEHALALLDKLTQTRTS